MLKLLGWVIRILAAVIMLQTLYFKFSAAPESVLIFTAVGMEPWGRYGVGVAELLAAVLILLPRTAGWGAFLTVGLMVGAVAMHVLFLGIEVLNDGGLLFTYAIVTLMCGLYTLWEHKHVLRADIASLRGK